MALHDQGEFWKTEYSYYEELLYEKHSSKIVHKLVQFVVTPIYHHLEFIEQSKYFTYLISHYEDWKFEIDASSLIHPLQLIFAYYEEKYHYQ